MSPSRFPEDEEHSAGVNGVASGKRRYAGCPLGGAKLNRI